MKMIEKLKRKIVIIVTSATFALMAFLLIIINSINYFVVVSEADAVIDMLSKPGVSFFDNTPNNKKTSNERSENSVKRPHDNANEEKTDRKITGNDEKSVSDKKKPDNFRRNNTVFSREMSPEVPYESRFFIVHVDEDGKMVDSDISRIISVNSDSVSDYMQDALKSGRERGFVDGFRFKKIEENGMTKIMFLDCGRKLDAFNGFMWISIGIGVFGCLIVFIVMMFITKHLVKPFKDSYESQRRFITNAGHEIKTPITIINANADLLKEDIGENESIDDIKIQAEKLTELTNEMICLLKLEEREGRIKKNIFSLSDAVKSAAREFVPLAETNNIDYAYEVLPGIEINGSEEDIKNLVSILLDNAVKYTQYGGKVRIELFKDKKSAVLTVVNSIAEELSEDNLRHLFDRFYRSDESRNSETGGHGLGLSIAQAIVNAHGGEISAANHDLDFSITVIIPI